MKKQRTATYYFGYSESVWKSLVVKALRIGWVEGLQMAAKTLPPSTTKSLLICGLFEDLFPVQWDDFNEALQECYNFDFEKLCSRATLHERGYAEDFVNMAEWACDKDKGIKYAYDKAMPNIQLNSSLKFLQPRIMNCVATWYKLNPQDRGVVREPLHMEFKGFPTAILDGHTFEGKKRGLPSMGYLSGHYENHRIMGKATEKAGWKSIRKKLLDDKVFPLNFDVERQNVLF